MSDCVGVAPVNESGKSSEFGKVSDGVAAQGPQPTATTRGAVTWRPPGQAASTGGNPNDPKPGLSTQIHEVVEPEPAHDRGNEAHEHFLRENAAEPPREGCS